MEAPLKAPPANQTLSFSFAGTAYKFGIDLVMTSTSHGLITRFDDNGTGSGTIDSQTSGVAQSALTGSYAFALNGTDTSFNALGNVGTFTLDANGNATGVEDFNDGGDSSAGLTNQALESGSTVLVGSSGAAGTSQLASSAFGVLGFDVWVIDATHLKLIETDATGLLLAGDAYVSTGQSFPSGNLVFTMSGIDDSATPGPPIAIGGVFSTASSPNTSGTESINDAGSVAQAPSFGVSFSTTGARTLLTLSSIYNGGWGVSSTSSTGTYTFAAYPYTYGTSGAGVVLLEVDSLGGESAGSAYLQSSTSFATGQGYGLNLSGVNETAEGEVDMIAEFTVPSSGTNVTGLYDANFAGTTAFDYNLDPSTSSPSTYSFSSGSGTMQFPSLQEPSSDPLPALNLTFFSIDGSNVAFIETDSDQVASGTFQLQNASGSSADAAALPHFAMVHPSPKAAAAKRSLKKQQ